MRTRYDVFGIGSPLMDLLVEAKDHDLKQLGLTKGCFHSISEEDSQRLLSARDVSRRGECTAR